MAKAYPHSVLAVVLTGMGQDGAHGITKIKEAGGCIIAQDEESCTVFGMPRAAIETGNTDFVVPLNLIAGQVSKLVNSRRVNV
jgi:two-component system chemotaxis response regulator CheB